MFRILSLSMALVIIVSCKGKIESKLADADELEIAFVTENLDSVTRIVKTDDAAAIRKFAAFLDGKQAGPFKCGYDGKMTFRKSGTELQQVDFRFKRKDCQHFSFNFEGKEMTTQLNQEAADLLQSLELGKNFY